METRDKGLGILLVILGSALFVLSAGKWLLHVVGLAFAVLIINYGLRLQGLPSLWALLSESVDYLKAKRN